MHVAIITSDFGYLDVHTYGHLHDEPDVVVHVRGCRYVLYMPTQLGHSGLDMTKWLSQVGLTTHVILHFTS